MRKSLGLMLALILAAGGARAADKSQPLPLPNAEGQSETVILYEGDTPGLSQPASCEAGQCRPCRACLSRLKDWLCYRSSISECKCEAAPCCRPPLYAFFLHRCQSCRRPYEEPVRYVGFNYSQMLHDTMPLPNCAGCETGCAACDHSR
jgi:hypothetical protein